MCESSGCRGAGRQARSAMQRGADAAKRGDVEELLENLAHSHVKVAKIEEVGVPILEGRDYFEFCELKPGLDMTASSAPPLKGCTRLPALHWFVVSVGSARRRSIRRRETHGAELLDRGLGRAAVCAAQSAAG